MRLLNSLLNSCLISSMTQVVFLFNTLHCRVNSFRVPRPRPWIVKPYGLCYIAGGVVVPLDCFEHFPRLYRAPSVVERPPLLANNAIGVGNIYGGQLENPQVVRPPYGKRISPTLDHHKGFDQYRPLIHLGSGRRDWKMPTKRILYSRHASHPRNHEEGEDENHSFHFVSPSPYLRQMNSSTCSPTIKLKPPWNTNEAKKLNRV